MKKLPIILIASCFALLLAGLLIYKNYQISQVSTQDPLKQARRELKENILEQKKLVKEQDRLTKIQTRQFKRDQRQFEKQHRKLLKQESSLSKNVDDQTETEVGSYSAESDQ